MTVSNTLATISHIIVDGVTSYPFPFKVFQPNEIRIIVALEASPLQPLPLVLTQDYNVNNLNKDEGGYIQLTPTGITKAPAGSKLTILRNMPFLQETDYRPHDAFPAESHERALDILTMQDQQLLEMINRALVALPGSGSVPTFEELSQLFNDAQAAADKAEAAADSAVAAAAAAVNQPLLFIAGSAGARSWTTPNLFQGRDYKVKVALKGGGGGGAGNLFFDVSGVRQFWTGGGGGEGETVTAYVMVSPGQTYLITVGAGGAGGIGNATGDGQGVSGQRGGETTGFSLNANPGAGGALFGGAGGGLNYITSDLVRVQGFAGQPGQFYLGGALPAQRSNGGGAGGGNRDREGGNLGGGGAGGGGSALPVNGGPGGDGFCGIWVLGPKAD